MLIDQHNYNMKRPSAELLNWDRKHASRSKEIVKRVNYDSLKAKSQWIFMIMIMFYNGTIQTKTGLKKLYTQY